MWLMLNFILPVFERRTKDAVEAFADGKLSRHDPPPSLIVEIDGDVTIT